MADYTGTPLAKKLRIGEGPRQIWSGLQFAYGKADRAALHRSL